MITKKKSQDKRRLLKYLSISIIALIVIIIVLFTYYIIKKDEEFKDRIYPNVFINNINFGRQTKDKIINYFEGKNRLLQKINITILNEDNIEATLSGEKLNLKYPSAALADRAYLIGRSELVTSRFYQKVSSILNFGSFDINTNVEYDTHIVDQFLSDTEDKYNLPAKNALFRFENEKVISFRKEEKGYEVDTKNFYESFAQIISNFKNNISDKKINLKIITLNPEITLSESNSFGIEELIGEGVSDYTHSDQDRVYNLTLATSKFNGVLIPKDTIFSFDDTVGEISQLTGYKPAYIIKGGKTVLGDGGGVCQVSTTFFRAALNAGLPIVERYSHAYRVSYYENDAKPGFDATVYPPTVDLKVKNDTPAYILIQTEIVPERNLIYFRLYGKKDGRKSEISNIKLYDVSPPPDPSYQDYPNLKRGVTKQIEIARWGGKASFDYKVERDSKLINEQTFISDFRPWRAVYLVGTAD